MSSVVGSLAGLGGWLVAARLMPQAEVGRAAAFVSGFILIATAAQLHVGVALLRWIPPAGRRTGAVILRTCLVVGPLALVTAVVYTLFAPSLAETAALALDASLPVGVAIFAVAAAGWCVWVLQDYVLVALGLAWWATARNAVFAVVRIGLLVALALAGAGAGGLVTSWVGPIVVWVVVGWAIIAVLVVRQTRAAGPGVLPGRAEVVGFIGPTSVAHIGVALLFNQVPLLVTLRWGDEPGAAFFVAWQAIIVVDSAAALFTNALSAQIAREPHRADELSATAARKMLTLFLPALAFGALIARPVLGVFGPGYAEASGVLQLLLLGLAFRLVVLNKLATLQAIGRAVTYSVLMLVSTLLVLVPVVTLPVGSGNVGDILAPIAIGYLAVQVVCAAAVFLPVFATRGHLAPAAGGARPPVS